MQVLWQILTTPLKPLPVTVVLDKSFLEKGRAFTKFEQS